MGKKARGRKPYQARFATYATNSSYAKNKKRKLERHLKKCPDDIQAINALKNIKDYARTAPKTSMYPITTQATVRCTQEGKNRTITIRTSRSTVELMAKLRRAQNAEDYANKCYLTKEQRAALRDQQKAAKARNVKDKKLKEDIVSARA